MDTVHPTQHEARGPRRRNRGAIVKLTLAGFALLGIGAAATSAAWTDDAVFSGAVSSASVSLQASLDGSTWKDADTVSGSGASATHVEIPAATFQNLIPSPTAGATRAIPVTLYIRNNGNSKLAVVATPTTTGTLFAGTAPLTVSLSQASWTLNPGAAAVSTVLTLTIPADWPATYKNTPGNSLTVTFSGTATP